MALPEFVATGELIESTWGNAVVDTLTTLHGCSIGHTGQAIPTSTTAAIAWNFEGWDTDNYHTPSATQVVIPDNLRGVYTDLGARPSDADVDAGASDVVLKHNGAVFGSGFIPVGKRSVSVSITMVPDDGDVYTVEVYNSSSATHHFSAYFNVIRTAIG